MVAQLKRYYHRMLAWLGDLVYWHPSRRLIVIGITGTKGKTTVAELLTSVLISAGRRTAMISSVHVRVGPRVERNATGNTMPGRLFIQRWLHRARQAQCEFAVLEVTSQGVAQSRQRHIDFDVAAITGLHPEHIESHGGFEQYRDAKATFFRMVARESRKPHKYFFINAQMNGGDAQYFEQAVLHPTGQPPFGTVHFFNRADLAAFLKRYRSQLPEWLLSDFNLDNVTLVYEIARQYGVTDEQIARGLIEAGELEGRMEFIEAETRHSGGAFRIVIDYAHTPGSFTALFSDLRQRAGRGRLVAVFGSYGEGRDTWKRPELGRIASQYCDDVVLTNEGPGDEEPRAILEAIAAGIPHQHSYRIIEDRREAIRYALTHARHGDIIALVGKGHERYINVGGERLPWQERGVAEELLRELQ